MSSRTPAAAKDGTAISQASTIVAESAPIPYSVFTKWQKRFIVGLVASAAWFSTLSSFIYYPSIPLIAKEQDLSITHVNLSVTAYMAIVGSIVDGRCSGYL